MAVKIGHASKDERSKFNSGTAGDQTGVEVYTLNWYNAGWNVVLRPKSSSLAEKSAVACEKACANNKIGYDQYQRNNLYKEAQKVGWDISKITTACECDCSSLMHTCAIIGGAHLTYGSNGLVTFNMVNAFVQSGDYEKLTGSQYCAQDAYLKRGDILVKESGHTAMVLSNGSKAGATTTTTTTKKSVEEVAKEVLNGLWGNGDTRKAKLTSAGYNYNEVQAMVNALASGKKTTTEIAKEVIAGKWGTGLVRKTKLTAAGYNYNEVQRKVNELLK